MPWTVERVRALLYEYPELKEQHVVGYGGGWLEERVRRSPTSWPVEREAIRLEEIARKVALVERLLEPLSTRDLALVRMRYFRQMPYSSIAKAMRCSSRTVWERDQQILAAMVKQLEEEDDGG